MQAQLQWPHYLMFGGVLLGSVPLAVGSFWGIPPFIVTFWAIAYQARLDPRPTYGFAAALFGALTTFTVVVLILLKTEPGILPVAVALGYAATASVFTRLWWQARARPSIDLPDVLGDQFPADSIYEEEGVQWAIDVHGEDLTEDAQAILTLQSCVDAERTCKIAFLRERPTQRAYFRVNPTSIVLPAGDVIEVTYPIFATEHSAKQFWVYVEVGVSGKAGVRNRSVRRQRAKRRVNVPEMLLFLLIGQLRWGGGLRLSFRSQGIRKRTSPPPIITTRAIWSARQHDAKLQPMRAG